MLLVLPLLALAATPIAPSAVLESPTRHVRTAYPYITSLLRDGFSRSPTFARLVTRLERSDLIVHIETSIMLPPGVEGRLMMLPRAHQTRYVRIQIAMQESHDDAIALIAHELQHAQELADAPDVTDMTAFAALYERIGVHSGWHQYETEAAQETARRVRREIGKPTRTSH
jgi:hypothetical protein